MRCIVEPLVQRLHMGPCICCRLQWEAVTAHLVTQVGCSFLNSALSVSKLQNNKNCLYRCILAYSDISAEYVLDLASRVLVTGADFLMLAPYDTFLNSTKPVRCSTAIAVNAIAKPHHVDKSQRSGRRWRAASAWH